MRLIQFALAGRDGELVADRCWQAGASGIWEVDDDTVRAGVDDEVAEDFCSALADLDPVDVTEVEAVELTGRAVTVEFGGHVVELWVPATVFGDATHPTTIACLSLLEPLVGPRRTVLDVGSGTGALSVAAALAGATVTAIDIDPVAVEATAGNAARNGVGVSVSGTPLEEVVGRHDVVVCNMTLGFLRPLVDALIERVADGGTLVLSGMLDDQWAEVRGLVGGDVADTRSVDGWVSAAITTPRRRSDL